MLFEYTKDYNLQVPLSTYDVVTASLRYLSFLARNSKKSGPSMGKRVWPSPTFEDSSVNNLKFLTVENALRDIAAFITEIEGEIR